MKENVLKTHNHNPAQWRGDLEEKLGYNQPSWRKRMAVVASFIDSKDKSVMDLGSGNMQLGNILPDGCEYIPVDYRKTSDKTIVCDFNKYEFPDIKADVVCAIGILGYIKDPEWFLEKIISCCRKCIITYKGREKYDGSMLYSEEIIDFLKARGWHIARRDTSLDEWTLIASFEKNASNSISSICNCTGCGACANICPVHAIEMRYDDNGYLKPLVNESECVHCEKCSLVCPALHKNENLNYTSPKCYALQASDDIRRNSSSGGFFSIFSKHVIENGGYVYGAVWDEKFYCHIKEASLQEEILPMRYSKYVQSRTDDTFSQVENRLKHGHIVLYFGCPCQIAGLNSYIANRGITAEEKERLITVDLVCFCSPSNVLFKKYLEEEFGIDNVKVVNFRDKSAKEGWSPVSYRIELEDGTVIYPEGWNDPYQRAFHGVLARRDTCDKCTYYKFPRQGDFTIGDFWGIECHDNSWADGKGVSVVLANNKKALGLIEQISGDFERIEEVPLDWSVNKGNRIGTEARPSHPNKKYFEYLLKTKSFREAVDMAEKGKYDIGLCCMFNLNTGNNLSNYALYKTLTDLGYAVRIITHPFSDCIEVKGQTVDKLARFLKSPYSEYAFGKKMTEKWEYYELNDSCNMFIVGSDQLWRAMFSVDYDYFFLLDWVRGDKFKMSYATSFGTEEFEGDVYCCAREAFLLKRMDQISVREKSGINIITDMTERLDTKVVLDPVFMCDVKAYEDMSVVGRMRLPKESYIGGYLLDITRNKENLLLEFADDVAEGRYVAITDYPASYEGDRINVLDEPAIEEWVAMIRFCDFFITDSFHGICFAIIFKKQFCVIFDRDNWRGFDRINSILEQFGISDRLVDSGDTQDVRRLMNSRIDYDPVYKILEGQKEKSLDYLRNTIKVGRGYRGFHTDFDLMLEKEYQIKMEQRRIKENLRILNSRMFLNSLCKKGTAMSEVVGFGSGVCFRRNIEKLEAICRIKYVCDNNPNKWGKELYDGVVCISPEKLKEMSDATVIIMVDDIGVSFEIAKQLVDMGVTDFTHITNWNRAVDMDIRV